ncbi:hypothetical protein HDU84_006322 [Entophlyctis sp. JEL0112]|nr:hypothetical protein HDU84_006322 [Entophlyctis sp. JEL0112]
MANTQPPLERIAPIRQWNRQHTSINTMAEIVDLVHPASTESKLAVTVDDPDVLADVALHVRTLAAQYRQQFKHEAQMRKNDLAASGKKGGKQIAVFNKGHSEGNTNNPEDVVVPEGSLKLLVLKEILKSGDKTYGEHDFVRVTRLAPGNLPLYIERLYECLHSYSRIITGDPKGSNVLEACIEHSRARVSDFDELIAKWEPGLAADFPLLTEELPECKQIYTEVHMEATVLDHMNTHTKSVTDENRFVMEWYVSFTDQELYAFKDSTKFYSEEIKALESPILPCLKDCLDDLSRNGIFHSNRRGHSSALYLDDVHFYLPKNKEAHELRYEELRLLSRSNANLCTPVLIMGVPKLATIITRGITDKPDSYGKLEEYYKRWHTDGKKYLKVLPDADRVKNNFICMSAPDRQGNPLRPRFGPYTRYQIRQIFRTAFTAFRGAVMKSKETLACLKCEDRERRPKAEKIEVVVHTGDWGTGEFENDETLVAFLQIAAAHAAGVKHLYYHVVKGKIELDSDAYGHVLRAKEMVEKVWNTTKNGDKLLLECMFEYLENHKFTWGKKEVVQAQLVSKTAESTKEPAKFEGWGTTVSDGGRKVDDATADLFFTMSGLGMNILLCTPENGENPGVRAAIERGAIVLDMSHNEYSDEVETGLPMAAAILHNLKKDQGRKWVYKDVFASNAFIDASGKKSNKFHVLSHFSRHIRPGMQILTLKKKTDTKKTETIANDTAENVPKSNDRKQNVLVDDVKEAVAAYDASTQKLVIVVANTGSPMFLDLELTGVLEVTGPANGWETRATAVENAKVSKVTGPANGCETRATAVENAKVLEVTGPANGCETRATAKISYEPFSIEVHKGLRVFRHIAEGSVVTIEISGVVFK